jgi:acyl carrier protein
MKEATMSTQQEVIDIIIEQLGIDASEVSPDKSFVEDLNADSLDLTELIMNFEERFGHEISETEAEQLKTVGDVINFIDQKKAELS